MATFKHLLVTTDFSEGSAAGARTARDLAGQLGARITLLTVVEEILPPMRHSSEVQRQQLRQQLVDASGTQLETWVQEYFSGQEATTLMRTGTAWREILTCIEEIKPDMVVMASQGRGAVGQIVFGSNTSRVLREASCPVLVVRQSD